MFLDMYERIYMVVDVGASRIPRGFEKLSLDALSDSGVEVGEIAFVALQIECAANDEPIPFDERAKNTIQVIRRNADGSWPISILGFFDALKHATWLIGHNLETDQRLLNLVHQELYGQSFIYVGNTFCTMLEGAPYARGLVHRGGKLVKKWPSLRELMAVLFYEEWVKGDIVEDVWACYRCANALMSTWTPPSPVAPEPPAPLVGDYVV